VTEQILLDQILISICVPTDLASNQADEIIRTLRNRRFERRLERAIRQHIESYPALQLVSLRISR
jgi:hypothetical protein